MCSIFGYLVVCIFYKWTVDWSAIGEPAPSLITLLIAFFMEPGTIPPAARLYPAQALVQVFSFSTRTPIYPICRTPPFPHISEFHPFCSYRSSSSLSPHSRCPSCCSQSRSSCGGAISSSRGIRCELGEKLGEYTRALAVGPSCHTRSAFSSHTSHVQPITPQLHPNHPPITLQSPSNNPPITLQSPSNHPPITLQLHPNHPPITLQAPSKHPPITLPSH